MDTALLFLVLLVANFYGIINMKGHYILRVIMVPLMLLWIASVFNLQINFVHYSKSSQHMILVLLAFYLASIVAVLYIIYIVIMKSNVHLYDGGYILTGVGTIAQYVLLKIDIWDIISGAAIFYMMCYITISCIKNRSNWYLWIAKIAMILYSLKLSYGVLWLLWGHYKY